MIKITFIEADGSEKVVNAEAGLSLMVAAVENNVKGIQAICNGCCSCGTCLVSIENRFIAHTSTKYSGEEQVLSKLNKQQPQHRLACQVIVKEDLNGMKVSVN
ncbi:2Fe-2S iron-sulfur cluster-binding protein [Thalassotalea crassostreae]|uniref:2Fe-2S iron-sulfur cluster-binding protein n=1 Tax=Thalassotalea crassostreae TaxID=1763536 RepID=UPI0008380444|nr:2Fe-2S iron-sulfur cluster-binding protein [Thalassotalea crassostreae]